MQSRAFLSQLTVTGDESGFFYVFSQRYGNFLSHSMNPGFFMSFRKGTEIFCHILSFHSISLALSRLSSIFLRFSAFCSSEIVGSLEKREQGNSAHLPQ